MKSRNVKYFLHCISLLIDICFEKEHFLFKWCPEKFYKDLQFLFMTKHLAKRLKDEFQFFVEKTFSLLFGER